MADQKIVFGKLKATYKALTGVTIKLKNERKYGMDYMTLNIKKDDGGSSQTEFISNTQYRDLNIQLTKTIGHIISEV